MGEKLGLVDTKTINVNNLLKLSNYNLIISQRDYSWTEDDIVNFWNDITKSDDEHFFGLMFFTQLKPTDKTISIVEGQQRLATITIFICVCRDILYEKDRNDPTHERFDSDFIHEFDYSTQTLRPKLYMSEIDREFFREFIQKKDTYENKKKEFEKKLQIQDIKLSEFLIAFCYEYFYNQIKKKIDKLSPKEGKDEIIRLINRITNDFWTITTTVTNENAIYRIFGTINARGLDLNNANLLKNYLFSKSGIHLEETKRYWSMIQNLLDENLNDFLRYFWIAQYYFIRDDELYDEMAEKITTPEEVLVFIQELRKNAEIFNQIINPIGSPNAVKLLKELNILGAKQVLPLLLLVKSKFDEDNFEKVVQACVNFTFRYSTICNLHNNKLEKLYYSTIAKKIRRGDITSAEDIIHELKIFDLYPTDSIFENKFKDRLLKTPKIARYILHKINFEMQTTKEIIGIDELTLEHVLPQSPDDEWKPYLQSKGIDIEDEEKMQKLIYNIGNLTLLASEYNEDAENKIFNKKRDEVYVNSHLPINEFLILNGTQTLKTITDWDGTVILNRAKVLAEKAKEIWKL